MYHVEDTLMTFQNSGSDQGEKVIRSQSLIRWIIWHSARNFMVPGKTPDFVNQMSIFYKTLQPLGCVTIKNNHQSEWEIYEASISNVDGLRHIFPFM